MELHEVTYDQAFSLGYARLGEGTVATTQPYGDLFAVDFAEDGSVYGLEVFGRVSHIPVDDMAAHFGWSSDIWSCVAIAARQLEKMMDAPKSSGSDGTFRRAHAWTTSSGANRRELV